MSGRLKVLALFDSGEPVPRGYDYTEDLKDERWKSEAQVVEGLGGLGHEIRILALFNDIQLLVDEIREFKPDVVFNLMEEYDGDHTMVPNVVAALEMLKIPYTGADPMGLRVCKDKALTKAILMQRGVATPPFQVIEVGRSPKRPPDVELPVVVKPNVNDASYGIAQASVADSDESFEERVRFLHEKTGQDALVETYVDGREIYASILGTKRTRVFPLREVKFGQLSEGTGQAIATYKVKWDAEYRKRWGVEYVYVEDLDEAAVRRIEDTARGAYKALQLNGYARIDLRLNSEEEPMVLEVNPNPYLAKDEDFGQSADRGGLPWENLLQAIINDAMRTDSA